MVLLRVNEKCAEAWTLQNPHHAELAWMLNCITPMGKLRRMTTWKVSVCCWRVRFYDLYLLSPGLPLRAMRGMTRRWMNRC